MTVWQNLGWAIFGAMLGNLSANATNQAMDRLYQVVCPGEDLLAEGLLFRRSAIERRLPGKHKEANAKFEQSFQCGNLTAMAHLGLAYCHGWGVARDRHHGARLIRTAFVRGARLTPEWFADPDICPAPKR